MRLGCDYSTINTQHSTLFNTAIKECNQQMRLGCDYSTINTHHSLFNTAIKECN